MLASTAPDVGRNLQPLMAVSARSSVIWRDGRRGKGGGTPSLGQVCLSLRFPLSCQVGSIRGPVDGERYSDLGWLGFSYIPLRRVLQYMDIIGHDFDGTAGTPEF